MRYQLLKTSPYISGQVRWDIPMYFHYDDGVHVVDTPELHIVPLDDNIRFNEGNSWETFNYSHLENIKHLFSEIGESFFSSEGEWTGNHWLYNEGDILDPYSHTYNMGARRTRFKRYGKQFSYLCPLWISEETDPKDLQFEISVKVSGEERDHIVRRKFKLSKKMCDYMKEYLYKSPRYVEPDPSAPDPGYQGVNDDLLSIKFDPDYAFIAGVQVDTGKFATKDVTYIIGDLLHREIPMMEFDNRLVSKFRESNIIAQQLINLNFLFNMEDISYILKESLLGKHVGVSMRVMYNDEYLPIKDFYTNYSDIPVYRADRNSISSSLNVCDYMGDNKIVDYMYINKFTQPIFHWAMVENPIYIYNFYDGFAPVFKDEGKFYRVEGRYYDQADISQETHNVYNSAALWCKLLNGTSINSFVINAYEQNALSDPDTYASKLFINESTGISYLNNNRYNTGKLDLESYKPKIDDDDKWPENIYIYSVIKNMESEYTDRLIFERNDSDSLIIRYESNDIVYATYLKLCELLRSSDHEVGDRKLEIIGDDIAKDGVIRLLIDMYDTWIPPYKIDFVRGTITSQVDSFGDYHPEECNMYKYNDHRGYVLRYTGGLCPLFINPTDEHYHNIVYRYKQWGDIISPEVQKYNQFLLTGMIPEYPSIGYYSFDQEPDGLSIPDWYNQWPWDVSWKNDGILYVLPEEFKTTIEVSEPYNYNNDKEIEEMWGKLYEYIKSIGISTESTWIKHKLKDLYEISYNFDYKKDPDGEVRNIKEIIYYVIFRLR